MKALLTGITGNIGHEVASELTKRGVDIVPIIRPSRQHDGARHGAEVIYSDLIGTDEIPFNGTADCIVHCAGNVHFQKAGNTNERMVQKVMALAARLDLPLYCVSTAFIYRPPNANKAFNNNYEQDKWRAEQTLISSGIPHAIFRPSILVGNSCTGAIQNFSGYYLVAQAFISALGRSRQQGRALRFPRLSGKANMVTVDQAAWGIGDAIEFGRLKNVFITNPAPPPADWVLKQTLEFFGLMDHIEFMDCSFEAFGELHLTEAERTLYQFGTHFYPYWSLTDDFPETVCVDNLITHTYLTKALNYFRHSLNASHAQPTYSL